MKARFVAVLPAFAAATAFAGDGPAPDGSADARTKAELLADAEKRFARIDGDGDGKLSGDEIPKGWLERYDLDGDGRISRTEFLDVSTRPPKLRHATPMRDPGPRARYDLAAFDKNKDGLVQREEYPGDPSKFRQFDRNADGVLSPDELLAMAREEIVEIRRKMRNPSRFEFLALFDADGDRKVGLDEYDGPIEVFRRFDRDGDGVVTYEELYPEKAAEKTGPRPADLTILDAMDKNRDGKVTRDEFKGTDAAWKRLDRNGDGVITISDAR